ncbi:MAG: SpoIVB peptidase S55 domain-containing protein [Thermoanaerobaculales bacterium]
MKHITVMMLMFLVAAVANAAAVELVDLAEATPGRTGICVTEMDGGERVEIPLTVLGTTGSTGPDGKIVLVRLQDPRFEETGIISGMSGSPVYLDGKLLGALAYGWPFSKAPIGGVTPFQQMLDVRSGPADRGGVAGRPKLSEIVDAAREGGLGTMLVEWLLPEGAGAMQPLPLTVAVGGWWAPSGGGWLAEGWRRMGWVAAPGGGASDGEAVTALAPGAMVAGVLVDGDVTLAAAGTVTEVRGDSLWAFGHLMFGAGSVRMPMARAQVVAVLPSRMNSFKFFTVGETIGEFVADRLHGVLGRVGTEAPMVPVRVAVDGRDYSFRSVRHPVLLPMMVGYLVHASHSARGRTFGNLTVTAKIDIRYRQRETATVEASFAGGQAPSEAAAYATAVMAYLAGSSFPAPEVESVNVELETFEGLRTATVLEVTPDRRVVRPGEELPVHFRLRLRGQPEVLRTLTIRIPDNIADGRLDLVAADGAAWSAYDLRMRPLNPASFADEVRLVNRLEPATRLVVALERQDIGMALAGGSVSTPPGIVLQMKSALGPNLQTTAYRVLGRVQEDLPFPVAGAQRVSLTVRSRN